MWNYVSKYNSHLIYNKNGALKTRNFKLITLKSKNLSFFQDLKKISKATTFATLAYLSDNALEELLNVLLHSSE